MPEQSAPSAALRPLPFERDNRPKLLDLFCGAGGAAAGYERAGFQVVGVDIKPQPHYPFEFYQADALEILDHGPALGRMPRLPEQFDVIHASPPCQAFSDLRSMPNAKAHTDLLTPTRARLIALSKPCVIENVEGSPMLDYLILCGTMFGLGSGGGQLRRHRRFEVRPALSALISPCQHRRGVVGVYGGGGQDKRRRPPSVGVYGNAGGQSRNGQEYNAAERREAMGIDWMTMAELSQAIPPAYTEWIGRQLMAYLTERRAVAATG